jgi:hypothetical protein
MQPAPSRSREKVRDRGQCKTISHGEPLQNHNVGLLALALAGSARAEGKQITWSVFGAAPYTIVDGESTIPRRS